MFFNQGSISLCLKHLSTQEASCHEEQRKYGLFALRLCVSTLDWAHSRDSTWPSNTVIVIGGTIRPKKPSTHHFYFHCQLASFVWDDASEIKQREHHYKLTFAFYGQQISQVCLWPCMNIPEDFNFPIIDGKTVGTHWLSMFIDQPIDRKYLGNVFEWTAQFKLIQLSGIIWNGRKWR